MTLLCRPLSVMPLVVSGILSVPREVGRVRLKEMLDLFSPYHCAAGETYDDGAYVEVESVCRVIMNPAPVSGFLSSVANAAVLLTLTPGIPVEESPIQSVL